MRFSSRPRLGFILAVAEGCVNIFGGRPFGGDNRIDRLMLSYPVHPVLLSKLLLQAALCHEVPSPGDLQDAGREATIFRVDMAPAQERGSGASAFVAGSAAPVLDNAIHLLRDLCPRIRAP